MLHGVYDCGYYIVVTSDYDDDETWHRTHTTFTEKAKDNDIEYTRTDAFIEKAVKYIANHFFAPGMDNEISDFVNYMKGE